MSSNKPEFLYKYLRAESGLTTLQSLSLRWSSPECYSDPFELGLATTIPFDVNSLLESTIKLASSMIFAPEQPKGDSPLINAIRRWREEERFSTQSEARPVLHDLLDKMVQHRKENLEGALMQWQELIRNQRICTFCAKHDTANAWERYADDHRGMAFRFDCTQAPFANALPVIYQSSRPQLTSIREQLGAIAHNRKDGMVERFQDLLLIKSTHNKSEQEWRCFQKSSRYISADNNHSEQWVDFLPFQPSSLTAIYLGLSASDTVRDQVKTLIKQNSLNTMLFQAIPNKTSYELEFEKVSV